MTSKVVKLNADGTAATVAEATVSDIFTTAVSMDSAVTGAYGVAQRLGLVALGMGFQNSRLTGSWNFLKPASQQQFL